MSKVKIVNTLIENGVKVKFNENHEGELDFNIADYLGELFEYDYDFDEDDIINLTNSVEDVNDFNQIFDHFKTNNSHIVIVLQETIGVYDFYSDYRDLEKLISIIVHNYPDLAEVIKSEEILDSSDFEEIQDKIRDDDLNIKFNELVNPNYWFNKLKSGNICSETFRNNIDTILESIPLEKLYELHEEIAREVSFAGSGIFNQRDIQFKLLVRIQNKDPELLEKVLESDDLYNWSLNDFEVKQMQVDAYKRDRQTNRISVDNANKIIEQNGLSNILVARQGTVGLEDMTFDYLYDLTEHKQLSEEKGSGRPWFYNRSFGDNQMPKDWFENIIDEYKDKV